ncbi:MAG: DNA-3-methyladenine glycosylase 2 family protein [Chloroflexi bacterium]|nr:MAG: DNA-3-methyladenine glycosylase 2 family protein [Chloroflexota bacterium]
MSERVDVVPSPLVGEGQGGGSWTAEFPLLGPAGELVDLRRVFLSHGITSLPPMRLDEKAWTFEITVPLAAVGARTLTISQARPGHGLVSVVGESLTSEVASAVMAQVRHVLSLDLDLMPFYTVAADDPDLNWVVRGAGRMVRSPTVFEDVVKTICTTNTSWGGTTRMVNALVEHLGEKAPGAPASGPYGRAFPTPQAMAAAPEHFYKTVAGAGYRGAYLKALSLAVAEGRVDVESLGRTSRDAVPDDEVAAQLQALPGVGPYAAAHIMLMLGRYSRLILDSWTRPKYARLLGRKRPVSDRTILRRFQRYGPYAGLAFWLVLTRDWITDEAPSYSWVQP